MIIYCPWFQFLSASLFPIDLLYTPIHARRQTIHPHRRHRRRPRPLLQALPRLRSHSAPQLRTHRPRIHTLRRHPSVPPLLHPQPTLLTTQPAPLRRRQGDLGAHHLPPLRVPAPGRSRACCARGTRAAHCRGVGCRHPEPRRRRGHERAGPACAPHGPVCVRTPSVRSATHTSPQPATKAPVPSRRSSSPILFTQPRSWASRTPRVPS